MDREGFTSVRVELPLDGLEAFRLASFNIEYAPEFAPLAWDRDCVDNRQWFITPSDRHQWAGNYVANLSAFQRFYGG